MLPLVIHESWMSYGPPWHYFFFLIYSVANGLWELHFGWWTLVTKNFFQKRIKEIFWAFCLFYLNCLHTHSTAELFSFIFFIFLPFFCKIIVSFILLLFIIVYNLSFLFSIIIFLNPFSFFFAHPLFHFFPLFPFSRILLFAQTMDVNSSLFLIDVQSLTASK